MFAFCILNYMVLNDAHCHFFSTELFVALARQRQDRAAPPPPPGSLQEAMEEDVNRQLAVAAFNSCDGFGGGVVFELGAVELGVAAAQGEQLGMGAVFGDPAILDDDDGVRGPDGGQPVRDDQRRPAG